MRERLTEPVNNVAEGESLLALAKHSAAAFAVITSNLHERIAALEARIVTLQTAGDAPGSASRVEESATGLRADFTGLGAETGESLSLQGLIDTVPDNLWVKDVNSRFVLVNQITASRMGFACPAELIGKSDLELLPPETAGKFYADEQAIVRTGAPLIDREECVFGVTGRKTWISTSKVPLRNARGEIYAIVGVSRDVTERRLADSLREGQAKILEMIATSASLPDVLANIVRLIEGQFDEVFASILLLDEAGECLRHGAAPSLPEAYTRAIDGVRIGPKVGSCGTAAYRRESVFVSDIQSDPLWEDFKALAESFSLRSCWSTPILAYDGGVLGTFAIYTKAVSEPRENEMRLIEVATRVAGIAIERKRAEDRIQFLANHDPLTQLPNRTLLEDRLSQAISHAREFDRWVTVLFIDLDNFKQINDNLGHGAGDELLKVVAQRMVACVKPADTVVRLGGDEFVVLLGDQPKSTEIVSATIRILQAAITDPIHIEDHELKISGSIGIANYPTDGQSAEAMIANADAAMYRAKAIGRNNFQFYTPDLNSEVHEKLLLHEQLRNAVTRAEFFLHYQPQVDLRSGRIFAVEALIRWRHPERGVIPPNTFIPLAEESGLIAPIGAWVLREACRQNKAWQTAGLALISVSVNVSARQFSDANLVTQVKQVLAETGLDAEYLELELTESLIMQDVAQAIRTMRELQALGVQLSIDDFGTGYSSLSALKTFPVARLKIDKSLIDDIPNSERDRAVASAVIALGRKLQLRVVAEGVESEEQLTFLKENNCDEMQGYHFSRPLGAEQLERLLDASRPAVSETER